MNMCPVCGSVMHDVFNAELLGKYDVSYRHCAECGLLQTEEPYWLNEAYSDAIAVADTGLVMRNLSLAAKLTVFLYLRSDPKAAYLDVAGGYGMLARLMRDYGFDYYWDDKYCQNLLARGFEVGKATGPFGALTAFEVLEHVHDPLAFIREQLERHSCRTLIFSTELYEGEEPPKKNWWYYAFNTGQHISFYQYRTLQKIAGNLGLKYFSLDGIHVFSDKDFRVNPWLRFAVGKLARALAPLVRYKLGSRTLADHYALMNQMGKQ